MSPFCNIQIITSQLKLTSQYDLGKQTLNRKFWSDHHLRWSFPLPWFALVSRSYVHLDTEFVAERQFNSVLQY
jgi:hypothetical protein